MGHHEAEITGLGARILATAVTTTFAQQAFAASLEVGYPLLSDWDRTVCADYGVRYDVWKGHAGLAKRSVFLIDRSGLLRSRWVTEDAMIEPDFDEVIAQLRRI